MRTSEERLGSQTRPMPPPSVNLPSNDVVGTAAEHMDKKVAAAAGDCTFQLRMRTVGVF